MIFQKINYLEILKNFKKFVIDGTWRFQCFCNSGALNDMPDREYLEKLWFSKMGKSIDLDNPITFNEKIQWLKLYDRKDIYTTVVDKIAVKEYVKKLIGEKYVIPTFGIWDTPDDIDFDALPNQFVLKCNHNSGIGTCICTNKKELNYEKVKKDLEIGLKENFFYAGREWAYKGVRPRILAEKYMVDESEVQLKDYKVFNFNGIPKLIQVDYDRFMNHKRNLYTPEWEFLDASIEYPNDPARIIARPERLEEMLELARILSKGIPYVRTDFYSIKERVYFGEMTLYPGCGWERFNPEELGVTMGNWLKLPVDR